MITDDSEFGSGFGVPKLDCGVVASGHDSSRVGRKGAGPNPVFVGGNRGQELFVLDVPKLERLVVGAGHEQRRVAGKGHVAHGARVRFEHFGAGLDRVGPKADRPVRRPAGDELARVVDVQRVNWARVPNKFERPQVFLEVPNHQNLVVGSGDQLLQIRVELHPRNEPSLALQRLHVLRKRLSVLYFRCLAFHLYLNLIYACGPCFCFQF